MQTPVGPSKSATSTKRRPRSEAVEMSSPGDGAIGDGAMALRFQVDGTSDGVVCQAHMPPKGCLIIAP